MNVGDDVFAARFVRNPRNSGKTLWKAQASVIQASASPVLLRLTDGSQEMDAVITSGGQVQIYEATNVVELHYCALTGATQATGSSATVGIESLTGSDGTQHSFNTPGSVATNQALRFTP